MGRKKRRQLREIDFESVDLDEDFDGLKDDVFSSGWTDAWEDNKKRKGRGRLAKRDRFADESPGDFPDWEDDYKIGDWEDDYRPGDWEDNYNSKDW